MSTMSEMLPTSMGGDPTRVEFNPNNGVIGGVNESPRVLCQKCNCYHDVNTNNVLIPAIKQKQQLQEQQERESRQNQLGSVLRVKTLDDLVQELNQVFSEDDVNIEYVEMLMRQYVSNPVEWRKYAKFDRYRYTRNLVDEGNGKFNLMLLCWGEGQHSSVHDHSDAHCFMKVLEGSLLETRFAWPDAEASNSETGEEEHVVKPLKEIGTTPLPLNDVCYINDSMGLHRAENNSHTEPAVSLHLYCPPYDSCHAFDQRTGNKISCKVTFWSKFGQKVNQKEDN